MSWQRKTSEHPRRAPLKKGAPMAVPPRLGGPSLNLHSPAVRVQPPSMQKNAVESAVIGLAVAAAVQYFSESPGLSVAAGLGAAGLTYGVKAREE